MKEILEGSKYFLILEKTAPLISYIVLIILLIVSVFLIVKNKDVKAIPLIICSILTITCVVVGFKIPASYYAENILDLNFKKELNEHISYLKENNKINNIDYYYDYSAHNDNYRIVMNINLHENENNFIKDNPSLSKSLEKDIQYYVFTPFTEN